MRRKKLNNQNLKTQTHKSKLPFALFLIAPLFIVVVAAIQTSHKGIELTNLERKISEIQKNNEQIQMEIIKESSLISLSENVETLGFMKPEKVLYLDKNNLASTLH